MRRHQDIRLCRSLRRNAGSSSASLSAISALLLLAAAAAGCATDSDTIVLKVAHNGSVEHPYQIGFDVFKEVLERDTDGRVEVQIFENAQLGTEEEASLMVKLGHE